MINNTYLYILKAKPSEIFQEFIEIMGEKIQLNKWTGYRGDMGKGKY